MIKDKLIAFQRNRRCTFLGVGPMSLNCVDVTIELANKHDVPIFLIASRRQIDSELFGGGYVNNWTTESFANYVLEKDKKGKVYLARDHGGPWQNPKEVNENFGLRQAMESAKQSYLSDLEAGFQILHIDPSIDIHKTPSIDETLERIFELYEYCWSKSKDINEDIAFEIGTEEQSGSTNSQEELEYTLNSIKVFCAKNNIPMPTFVVIQCGTKVLETSNVGSFESPLRIANEIPAEIQLPKMLNICEKYGLMMKEHNTDYLSNDSLGWHPKLGIHAANVAPEFGVSETKAFLDILYKYKLKDIAEQFISLSYESKKWSKWLKPNSNANKIEKAILSGHYIFSSEQFIEIKKDASNLLRKRGVDLDDFLKLSIEKSISRYLSNFRLIRK